MYKNLNEFFVFTMKTYTSIFCNVPFVRQYIVYYSYLMNVTAGRPVSPRGHIYPIAAVGFG